MEEEAALQCPHPPEKQPNHSVQSTGSWPSRVTAGATRSHRLARFSIPTSTTDGKDGQLLFQVLPLAGWAGWAGWAHRAHHQSFKLMVAFFTEVFE